MFAAERFGVEDRAFELRSDREWSLVEPHLVHAE
jgi:hypothetical protein